MKSASPALIALLATRQFFSADLFQFSLVGGTTLYYCGGDQDIVWNGITWSAGKQTGPYFDRKDNKAKCHWKIGVEVDTLVFDVLPGSATVSGDPFLSAVRQGVFDGAELTLYRAFMPTYGDTTAGAVTMFVGRMAEVDASRSLATFSVSSHLELFNQNMPRNLYQPGCVNTLFDASCTLSKAAFAASPVCAGTQSAYQIQASIGQPTGYFDLGTIAFTSGANAGFSRTVQRWVNGSPGVLTLSSPFPNVPANGDAFLAYPGCDKRQSTCASKFRNLQHFRGFPNIPSPATAV